MSKANKRKLRKLSGIAYRRELDRELELLYAQFQRWKQGDLSPWELSEQIHEFHQGPNRDLYSFYNDRNLKFTVAHAITAGILANDEIPEEVREELAGLVETQRTER